MRDDLPTGTVTFLFTDVEGSTRLLHSFGPEAYANELAEHRRIIREACAAEGGVEVDTQMPSSSPFRPRPAHSRRRPRSQRRWHSALSKSASASIPERRLSPTRGTSGMTCTAPLASQPSVTAGRCSWLPRQQL